MRRHALILLATSFALTGCIESNSPQLQRVGYVFTRSYVSSGQPVVRVSAVVNEGYSLTEGIGTAETCQVLQYSPSGGEAGALTLDAGTSMVATIGTEVATLDKVTVGTNISYEMDPGTSLTYTPGDTVTVVAPGAAFPGFTIEGKTSEAFVLDPVNPPAAGEPMTLNWSPAPTPGSLMTVSLRYNAGGTGVTPNEQIYCVFIDDGTASLSSGLGALWAGADEASRSVFAERVRQSAEVLGGNTRVRLFSFYTVPTPSLTP